MFDQALTKEIERFANVMKDVPDADLDRTSVWGAYKDDGVPTLIVFLFLQRYFIGGLTLGSGK